MSKVIPCDYCRSNRWKLLDFDTRRIWCLNCGATRCFVISELIHINGSEIKNEKEQMPTL